MGEGLGWFRVLSFGVYHVRKMTWGLGFRAVRRSRASECIY